MWTAVTATTPTVVTTSPHSGTYALEAATATRDVSREFGGTIGSDDRTSGTIFYRFYFYISSSGSSSGFDDIFRNVSSGGSPGMVVQFQSTTRLLRLRNAVAAVNSTFSNALSTSTWYRIELRHLLSDTVGEMEINVYVGDSTTVFETASQSGADTLPTNLRTAMRIGNISSTNVGTLRFDDICINDSSGSSPTSWCGAGKIALKAPASDDTVTWGRNGAGCTGTTNADCADDVPGAPDDTTTYNSSASVQTDRLNTTGLPAEVTSDATMRFFHLTGRYGGSSTSGTNTARFSVWDEGGSETNSTTQALCDTTGWIFPRLSADQVYVDLSGKTKSNVDSFDIGYEPVSLAQSCRMTALWANVEWLEAPACAGSPIALLGAGCK